MKARDGVRGEGRQTDLAKQIGHYIEAPDFLDWPLHPKPGLKFDVVIEKPSEAKPGTKYNQTIHLGGNSFRRADRRRFNVPFVEWRRPSASKLRKGQILLANGRSPPRSPRAAGAARDTATKGKERTSRKRGREDSAPHESGDNRAKQHKSGTPDIKDKPREKDKRGRPRKNRDGSSRNTPDRDEEGGKGKPGKGGGAGKDGQGKGAALKDRITKPDGKGGDKRGRSDGQGKDKPQKDKPKNRGRPRKDQDESKKGGGGKGPQLSYEGWVAMGLNVESPFREIREDVVEVFVVKTMDDVG
ncbi:hypothetical protein B0H63DRAFT_506644 [Podospora didyma]|uniref:Uncharacterized protein n=1 Tax=Podospora didyma TaxID=330526 RepID=A0AAE0P827_9PEZI|nr:hypothetical protein B0H63DRAFT_506644 [Podospora didyma]